jgi:transmembrane sensor
VRPDATRPFRVHAGPGVVEALGTQFDVQSGNEHATVAVVEGVVKLTSTPSVMRVLQGNLGSTEIPKIEAGESATLREDGRTDGVQPVDVAKATSWRLAEERMEFKNVRLAEIAEAFNRYNAAPKLTIEGEALRNRRFLIRFKSANPKLLLQALQEDGTLEFIKNGNDVVIRERSR